MSLSMYIPVDMIEPAVNGNVIQGLQEAISVRYGHMQAMTQTFPHRSFSIDTEVEEYPRAQINEIVILLIELFFLQAALPFNHKCLSTTDSALRYLNLNRISSPFKSSVSLGQHLSIYIFFSFPYFGSGIAPAVAVCVSPQVNRHIPGNYHRKF
jgi:hypothetical protein